MEVMTIGGYESVERHPGDTAHVTFLIAVSLALILGS
jgi:hypothetical protein